MVEVTHEGNEILVQSIYKIHETNLVLGEKCASTQESRMDKQLHYYINKDQEINDMIRAIPSLMQVMNMVLKQDTTNANNDPRSKVSHGNAIDKNDLQNWQLMIQCA